MSALSQFSNSSTKYIKNKVYLCLHCKKEGKGNKIYPSSNITSHIKKIHLPKMIKKEEIRTYKIQRDIDFQVTSEYTTVKRTNNYQMNDFS